MQQSSFTVAPPRDPRAAALLGPVIASLPLSLHPADGQADLALAVGADWVEQARAAMLSGVRGILVSFPGPTRPEAIAELRTTAADGGASVVLDMPWTTHPAVADAVAAWQPSADGATLVDSFVAGDLGGSVTETAIAQLFLLQTVVGPLGELAVDHWDEHGYAMRARTADGAPVSIAATTDGDGEARAIVRILSLPTLIDIAVAASDTWRPASALRADADGELRRPPMFESGHRAAWKRLRDAVAGSTQPDDLDRLHAAATLLDTVAASATC